MDVEPTAWARAVNYALANAFAANCWVIRLTEDDDSIPGLPQEMIDEIMLFALLPDEPVAQTATITPPIYRINGNSTHFFKGDADARRLIYVYLLPDSNKLIEPECEVDRAARARDREMLKLANLQMPNRTLDLMLVNKQMCREVADVMYKSRTFGLHLHQGKGKAGGVEFLRAGRQQLGYATDITDRRFTKFARDGLYGFCNLKQIDITIFPPCTGDRHLVMNTYYMMQALARLLHRPSEPEKQINKLIIRFGEQTIPDNQGRPVTQARLEDSWWDATRGQPRETSVHHMPDIRLVLFALAALSHVSNVSILLPDALARHEPTILFVRQLIMHMASDGVQPFDDGCLEWKLDASRDTLEAWLEESSRPEAWDEEMLISEDEFLQRQPADSANAGTAGTSNAVPSNPRPSIFGPFHAGPSDSGPSVAGPSDFERSNTKPSVPGPSTTRPSNAASGPGHQYGRILRRRPESSWSLPPNGPASVGPSLVVRTGGRFLGTLERLTGVQTTVSSSPDTGTTLGAETRISPTSHTVRVANSTRTQERSSANGDPGNSINDTTRFGRTLCEHDSSHTRIGGDGMNGTGHQGLPLDGQAHAEPVPDTAASGRTLGGQNRPLQLRTQHTIDTAGNSGHVLDGTDIASFSRTLPEMETSGTESRLQASRSWDVAWTNGARDHRRTLGDRNRSPPPSRPRAGEATPARTRLEAFNGEQDALEGTGGRTLSSLGGDGSWDTAVGTREIDEERQQRQNVLNRAATAPPTHSAVSVLQQSSLQQSGSAPPICDPGHKGKGKGKAKDQMFKIFQDPTEE